MKQKPFFLKYLTIAISIASVLIPASRLLHLNIIPSNQEGYHPKTVNLASPDAIIGVDNNQCAEDTEETDQDKGGY